MHKISGIIVCTKNWDAKDTVLKYLDKKDVHFLPQNLPS